MRSAAYKYDLFVFDNRDVIVVGEDEATDEIKKSIEDYEHQDEEFIFSKEDLEILKCTPAKDIYVDLEKGVIKTPLRPDGAVDYDKVPKDGSASIWVTVTKPGSPLEGRPILLTRRPDGLFAITGGAGYKHLKDKAGVKTRTEALRHLVVEGRPSKTKADKELDELNKKLIAQNEPLIQKKKELMRQGRQEVSAALQSFNEAIGIKESDAAKIRKHREEIVEYAVKHGLDEDTANNFAASAVRHHTIINRQRNEVRRREVAKKMFDTLRRMNEGEDAGEALQELNEGLEFRKVTVELPSPEQFKGMSPEEIDSKMGDVFNEKFGGIINPNPLDGTIDEELKAEGIDLGAPKEDAYTLEIGTEIEPLDIKNEAALSHAFQTFREYQTTKREVNEVGKRIRKVDLTDTTPALLEKMRAEARDVLGSDISEEEMAEIENSYSEQWQANNSAQSFYKAVSEFWNDETAIRQKVHRTDNGFGSYVNEGANSALAAITGRYLGERVDASSLVDRTSIEAAAMVIAFDLRDRLRDDPSKYNAIVTALEDYNATNQIETEKRALERHAVLKKRYDTIQRAKETGLLTAREETGMVEGEVDNLIEQKKNLGHALGSMQASAAFLNALMIAKDARDNAIELNFGSDAEGANMRLEELRLNARGAIDNSDPNNIKLITGARALRRYAKALDVTKDFHDENERIKNDESGTEVDDLGNVIVPDYDVPMWNETFTGPDGKTHRYYSRVEQRNDIEFLKKMNNGLITRVTGAGKTNTALGFFAHKISENPNYSGLVVVPKGRTGQWADEAKMYSQLDMVLIPEGTSKDERSKIIAGIKPGQVAVIAQRDAAVSYYDLEYAFLSGRLRGMTLDEPQEIASRSISGNMSAATRKLMKLPSENRIALTATPARDNLIEAYDLVNWVSHGDRKLGPRTRFQRVYGGYGSGTNAQDAALQQMIYREISPYMSGGRLTNPSFKVNRQDVVVSKSELQDGNMREIESGAKAFMDREKAAFIQGIENDPKKLKYYEGRWGNRWKIQAAIKANERSRKRLLDEHDNNLSGIMENMSWADNPKINAAVNRIGAETDKKHVVFLDNAQQRRAVHEGLLAMGYTRAQIRNIATSTTSRGIQGHKMAEQVKEFRTDPSARVIFIDKQSCSGYNLQEGDDLHVLGTPTDAASYLQAQGRLARMPREGDVGIYTYKYDDVPFEDNKWTKMEQQLAILQATAPGMFAGG